MQNLEMLQNLSNLRNLRVILTLLSDFRQKFELNVLRLQGPLTHIFIIRTPTKASLNFQNPVQVKQLSLCLCGV
jgi:hypothetical protein